jgi:hypothetical protein
MKKVFVFSPLLWILIPAFFVGCLNGSHAQNTPKQHEEAALKLIEEFNNTPLPAVP